MNSQVEIHESTLAGITPVGCDLVLRLGPASSIDRRVGQASIRAPGGSKTSSWSSPMP
jgi:hypothetical protein